ncbi:C4-dicarboxylate ABC transporter [Cryptosporangium sp. NPDC048952]|uniref:SLAC1 family transporter n=1 Tax=Cryptosporangium sp. NPDC048952 TaxID=3363961 RepID=UPI00371FC3CA
MNTLTGPGAGLANGGGVTPNWFAAVMGTGIVAVGAAGLPVQLPGLRVLATLTWLAAAALLVALLVASAKQWRRAATHAADPIMLHFYGAPPMALMTVGGGALVLSGAAPAAVALDAVLWTIGTVGGLATAVYIPYRMITRQQRDLPFGGWLMPVVPPMVSAANGALLAPHVPFSADIEVVSTALFGASLLAALLVLAQLWNRLLTGPPLPAKLVPTLWIVLGPLGQSITAAHLLWDDPLAYTLPVWGFAMLWLVLVTAVTIKTKPPFGPTWWGFTFPTGTLVTGTTAAAADTGSPMLTAAAVALFLLLLTLWATVSVLTLRHAVHRREGQPVAVHHLTPERNQ